MPRTLFPFYLHVQPHALVVLDICDEIESMRISSLLREVPKVIQQDAALIVAYREILASYGKVHGSDVSERCFARWPIAKDRQRRKVDQT